MSNVKSYTDKQLLDRAKSLPSFKGFPPLYWLMGVRSNEDAPDEFDDKFYLFKGEEFIMVTSGTTNPGVKGLMNFIEYNKDGCAVIKADEWYHNLWRNGIHRGKMKALVQYSDVLYYRDNNKNKKSEQIGKLYKGKIGINFHTCTYNTNSNFLKKFVSRLIGPWSLGCQVPNVAQDYYQIIEKVSTQLIVSYCLLNEF